MFISRARLRQQLIANREAAYRNGFNDARADFAADAPEVITGLQNLLALRTKERDAALDTLDTAVLLVEALFARQNELALAAGKEPPFLEDLKTIRGILNGEGRSVT